MKEFLIIIQDSFTVWAENEDDASDKANEILVENGSSANVEIIEEL